MKKLIMVAFALALVPAFASQVSAQSISMERARRIAQRSVPNGQGIKKAELKKKDGLMVYDIDVETPGSGHQEVLIDANTGAVVKNKHEDSIIGHTGAAIGGAASAVGSAVDHVFTKDEYTTVHYVIPEERAIRIAQRTVPNGSVKDTDLERKKGILVWKVDIDTPGHGYEEVRVDAQTGGVVRVHHEH